MENKEVGARGHPLEADVKRQNLPPFPRTGRLRISRRQGLLDKSPVLLYFLCQLDEGVYMPEICRFLGIVFTMYFDEHNPPHFHVRYNEYRASLDIETLNVVAGAIPARVRGLVEEWAELHKDELLQMWVSKEFHRITPLV